MTDFLQGLKLSTRVTLTLRASAINSEAPFLALTRDQYRAMPNWISKGWAEIEAKQAEIKAGGLPHSDVNVQSVYAFLRDGLQIMEDGLEDAAGQQRWADIEEVLDADGKNVQSIEVQIHPEEDRPDMPTFRITVERIA